MTVRATPAQLDMLKANLTGKPPAKARVKRKREDLPENQVGNAIKGFLTAHGWRPYRMLAGKFRTMDGHRVVTGAPKDTPDWVFFRGPEYCFIEFKRLGGQPNPNQAICIAQMRQEGMPVFVANDYDQFTAGYLQRFPEENAGTLCVGGEMTLSGTKRLRYGRLIGKPAGVLG